MFSRFSVTLLPVRLLPSSKDGVDQDPEAVPLEPVPPVCPRFDIGRKGEGVTPLWLPSWPRRGVRPPPPPR